MDFDAEAKKVANDFWGHHGGFPRLQELIAAALRAMYEAGQLAMREQIDADFSRRMTSALAERRGCENDQPFARAAFIRANDEYTRWFNALDCLRSLQPS